MSNQEVKDEKGVKEEKKPSQLMQKISKVEARDVLLYGIGGMIIASLFKLSTIYCKSKIGEELRIVTTTLHSDEAMRVLFSHLESNIFAIDEVGYRTLGKQVDGLMTMFAKMTQKKPVYPHEQQAARKEASDMYEQIKEHSLGRVQYVYYSNHNQPLERKDFDKLLEKIGIRTKQYVQNIYLLTEPSL